MEKQIELEGKVFTLVMDFRAVNTLEGLVNMPFSEILQTAGKTKDTSYISFWVKVFWVCIQKHHKGEYKSPDKLIDAFSLASYMKIIEGLTIFMLESMGINPNEVAAEPSIEGDVKEEKKSPSQLGDVEKQPLDTE